MLERVILSFFSFFSFAWVHIFAIGTHGMDCVVACGSSRLRTPLSYAASSRHVVAAKLLAHAMVAELPSLSCLHHHIAANLL